MTVPEATPTRYPLIAACLIGCAALLLSLPPSWQALLQYERTAVLSGQWWRLISGHLVHAGPFHLLENLAALAVIALLFGSQQKILAWLWVTTTALLAIDIGLLMQPSIQWYLGLSGLLHGLLLLGLLSEWQRNRGRAGLLLALLGGKLLLEQSPLSWLHWQPDALPILVQAHLHGAMGAFAGWLLLMMASKTQASRSSSP